MQERYSHIRRRYPATPGDVPGTFVDARGQAVALGVCASVGNRMHVGPTRCTPERAERRDVNYLTIPATGFWSNAGAVPKGFDPAFAQGYTDGPARSRARPPRFSSGCGPSGKYLVAIGFFDPNTTPGKRLQEVLIDGRKVDTLDTAGPRPFVRLYDAADLNGDGFLQVSCSHVKDEGEATGLMNIVWLFDAGQRAKVDAEKLARGDCPVKPLCRFDAAAADCRPRGHVDFPKLPEARLKRMLPLRPVALGIEPARPQPVDPLHLEIQGELRNRIRTVLDRWGYAGRDQKRGGGLPGRRRLRHLRPALEVYCMFSRLLKIDLDLQVPFEALLARQQKSGDLAGAFTGGAGKPRLACSWEQGILLQAMLAYYEHSGGDPRALEAAGRIVDWEDRMISGKINVGSWGGNGRFGALEGLVTYAWRTKDPKALAGGKENRRGQPRGGRHPLDVPRRTGKGLRRAHALLLDDRARFPLALRLHRRSQLPRRRRGRLRSGLRRLHLGERLRFGVDLARCEALLCHRRMLLHGRRNHAELPLGRPDRRGAILRSRRRLVLQRSAVSSVV